MNLKESIRTIPDFPKAGIMYRDITALLASPEALTESIAQLALPYKGLQIDYVAGIEARGFVFGAALAIQLGAGFLPVRKAGKLPGETLKQDYVLEYGTDCLEIHTDDIGAGQRVLLVDDLIATGGTAQAAINLLKKAGADVMGAAFVIDLPALKGAQAVRDMGVNVHALMAFEGH